jgi:acetyl esterase
VQHFSLEYRLAPEHPYPAPVDDAVAALAALTADPEGFGVDVERLGIGGNSAGAAISASTSLRVRDAGAPRLAHVDLEVPPAALRPVGASAEEYAVGFGLDEMELIASMYVGPHGPADDYASALDAPDLAGLPPHLIMVAEFDPLRDSGIAYADRLRASGVEVDLFAGERQLHGSPGQTAASPAAADWQAEHSRLLARAYRTR